MKNFSIKNKKVFVGISGGVDSSVAAALLKAQGAQVTGVFIKTWVPPFMSCPWKEERRDAIRVCAALGIPFLDCDATEEYRKTVGEYFIDAYKKGRTPNPDVLCNREIKFGVFWGFARAHGAAYIATGHYARTDGVSVYTAKDVQKDQSYFLWMLTKEDCAHTLFPLGDYTKADVRVLAKKYHLFTSTKKDSQGICFLGDIDMKDFLKQYIPENPGIVISTDNEPIGTHPGATFFTLGERHGFTITKKTTHDTPYYVVGKNIEENILIVSTKSHQSGLEKTTYLLENTRIDDHVEYAQIRYHGEKYPCTINDTTVIFEQPVLIASGQSIVFYAKDRCVGGGIVV